jgi:hypothetical protein
MLSLRARHWIERYRINSPMLPDMKANADGSLTLYIQNKFAAARRQSPRQQRPLMAPSR